MQARYSSLDSCDALDAHCLADQQQLQQQQICASTPPGMCYAPMPPQARPRSGCAAHFRRPAAGPGSPARAAHAAADADITRDAGTESEARAGLRHRACKRKIKYSDGGTPSSTTSGASLRHDVLASTSVALAWPARGRAVYL